MAQFQIFSWLLLGGIGTPCGTSVLIVCVAVKIQAGHLPNKSSVVLLETVCSVPKTSSVCRNHVIQACRGMKAYKTCL